MKLTCIIMLLALVQVSAATFGQTLTLKQDGVSISRIFWEIRKQTGYDVLVESDRFNTSQRIDVAFSDAPLRSVLDQLLKNTGLGYAFDQKTVIIKTRENADVLPVIQRMDVSGRVLDQEGQPLIGAGIKVVGRPLATTSDKEGRFRLAGVEERELLEITFVGFKRRELKAAGELGDIVMEMATGELDEVQVVNTGYQSLPRERATGSFATVDNKTFNLQIGTDIISRLPNVANSLVVDRSRTNTGQLMVRGLSTIAGPKDPLIVVDNFPYDGDLDNINPNIVENITILKDAAAASIWGARAGNGVIVITTKSGKFNQPTKINFTSNLSLVEKPDLSYIRQMSSSDFIELEQELFNRNFYNSQLTSASKPLLSPVVELLAKVRSGALDTQEAQRQIDAMKSLDARDDFNKYMYRPGLKQQYFFNASGGSQKFSWTSGVGLDHNRENLGETYQRINLRFHNTYTPIKKLVIATSLYYTQTRQANGRYGYGEVNMKNGNFVPYMQMADANGNALWVGKDYSQSFIETVGNGQLLDWKYYPLDDWRYQTTKANGSDILLTANVNYEIIAGLKASVNYQYQRQFGEREMLADIQGYTARSYINSFAQINNGVVVFPVPVGSWLDKANSTLTANNVRGQLGYDNTFGKHHISAILGAETRMVDNFGHQGRFYGYDPKNLTFANVNYAITYPRFISGSGFIQNPQSLSEKHTGFVSQFANAAYTFDDRYVLSASLRRDASNLFGLTTNDQWNPFFSVGLAWNLSNEKFYGLAWLPYLKLRTTYGVSGNINPAMVAQNTIEYSASKSGLNGEDIALVRNYFNPMLRWETAKMFNLAMDFRSRNERFTGTIEFYRKRGINLFGESPLDPSTGIAPWTIRNVASMNGYGWDFELKSLNINGELKWRTTLNLSLYKDEVDEYLINFTTARQYVVSNSPPISGVKGHPVYSMYAYRWAGLDPATGEAQGYLDGQVSKNYAAITGTGTKFEDLEFHGSAIPTRFGSMINDFSYKKFSLQVGISFKLGYSIRRSSVNYTDLLNSWRGHDDYAHRWQQSGDEQFTDVPAVAYTANSNRDAFYASSSVLIEKGDHVRLQFINFNYQLTLNGGQKNRIRKVDLFVNLSNLGVLWRANRVGLDPDFNLTSSRTVTPRMYALGIRTNF